MRLALIIAGLLLIGLVAACGDDAAPTTAADPEPDASAAGQMFPDVIGGEITAEDGGTWTVRATISSPYDTPERYADAWRVLDPEGTVLGVRELAHDHASEQPFTRALAGVNIPPGITTLTIEGRDRANGWGGATFDLDVPTT